MPTNNAINLNAVGIAKYDGAGTFSSTTTTLHSVLIGGAANAISNLALTNGQLAIGSTGADPSAAAITAGTGIGIVLGAGAITVNAVGGGLTWSVKGANTALVVNNGFISTTGAGISYALPTTSAVGDTVALVLDGSTSWTITQGAGQSIRFGSSSTTGGVGGSLASTAQGDAVEMVCSVANTKWNVISSMGNITIV